MIKSLIAVAAGLLIAGGVAHAHPHVWVTMKSQVVYAPDGTIAGVRHAWTFDDMFSTFAVQGLETKEKGKFSREELQPLAEVNVSSLKEYDFFTYAKADGRRAKLPFLEPKDYHLEYNDKLLTLHFLLPLKTPVKAQSLDLEIFDPLYFVDFTFDEKDPASLSGAPAQCKLTVTRPGEPSAPNVQRLPDAMANQADTANFGQQFASKLMVKCP